MPIKFDGDPEISLLIDKEEARQENEISLIASENYAPANILKAMGSVLTNKYAEGLPGKRFYAGCSVVDAVETLAIERCKKLFGASHVNVQPHAGSQANMAVYMSCLKPGDTILGMDLVSGGHLTHGYKANFSGALYRVVSYGVSRETECIDYDQVYTIAQQCRPKLIIAGASAYPRIIDFAKFAQIAKSVDALFMADIAHIAGLVAAGLHPSPIACADFVTSTTHKTLCGPRGAFVMCKDGFAQALDRTVMPGIQGGPCMHVIAAKAICFGNGLRPEFVRYQQKIINNARAMSDVLAELGYRIVSGGTDNHMIIIDLTGQGCNGKEAEQVLECAGITVSRSCIPFDTQKPTLGSGIRIGTSAITTRGMTEKEAQDVAFMMHEVIKHRDEQCFIEAVRQRVESLCKHFPIYSSF